MPIQVPATGGSELATSVITSDDGRLLQAEALVRSFCRWHIAPLRQGVVFTVNGSGGSNLFLPTLHLVAVTSVVEDGLTVDLADVQWSEEGRLWRDDPWTSNLRGVTVTADHGFDSVPSEVEGVVQAVAQRAIDNASSQTRTQRGPFVDMNSQTGTNEAPALALLESEKRTLRAYRIPVA